MDRTSSNFRALVFIFVFLTVSCTVQPNLQIEDSVLETEEISSTSSEAASEAFSVGGFSESPVLFGSELSVILSETGSVLFYRSYRQLEL